MKEGELLEHLQRALVGAYDVGELRQALKFGMNVDLAHVTGASGLSAQVYDLITWAERNGRLDELLRVACDRRPTDPALAALRTALPGQPRPSAPVRSNLPPRHTALIGRAVQVDEILRLLRLKEPLIAIQGEIGIGKSALANIVAHTCQEERLFDTFYWWNARYTRTPTDEFLRSLGRFLEDRRPTDPSTAGYSREYVHELLRSARTLLVITKVTEDYHGEIIEFLHDTPQDTSCIVTSLSLITFASRVIRPEPFNEDEARALLQSRLAKLECRIPALSTEQIAELNALSGGSPVILSLAAGWLCRGDRFEDLTRTLTSDRKNPLRALCKSLYDDLGPLEKSALEVICSHGDKISGEELMHSLGVTDAYVLNDEVLSRLRSRALLREDRGDTFAESSFSPASGPLRRMFLSLFQ